jgi:heptosyltransferase-3
MSSPARVLIYRLGSLGDTVIALPCFHFIRRTFPSADITLLTNRPVAAKAAPLASVLGSTGLFDHLLDYPVELRSFAEIRELRNRIRRHSFDIAIHLTPARGLLNSIRDYLFFRWCGIGRVIGVPFRNVGLKSAPVAAGLYENESIRLAKRLRGLGEVDLSHRDSWDLLLTADEIRQSDRLLAESEIAPPFLAISLGSKLMVKDWSVDNWRSFVRSISLLYPRLSIVAVGAEDERAAVDGVLAEWKGRLVNLCGRIPPRLSAAILQYASLFVGHDSGPLHLAAAVGTPCVAMFSAHAPPGQWFPRGDRNTILLPETLCAECERADCHQINGKCILSISVDTVVAAVKQQLDARLPAPAV